MIIICVFTDLFLSLSLVMEKEEFDLVDLPPRNHKKDHLVNLKIYVQSYLFIGVIKTVCAHSMFFFYMYKHAGVPFHALIFAFEKYSDGFYGYTEAELTHFNTVGQSVYLVTSLYCNGATSSAFAINGSRSFKLTPSGKREETLICWRVQR